MKKLQRFLSMLILIVLISGTVLPTLVYAEGDEVSYEEVEWESVKDRTADDDDSNWLLTAVESLLAGIVARLANCVNFLISKAVGQQVIIDDLIFNYQGQPADERIFADKIRLF